MRVREALVLFGCVLFLAGCGKKEMVVDTTEATTEEATEPTTEEVTTVAETEPETISHEGEVRSYLTGEWVSEEIGRRRPVAIMLNNIKAAVPQTGISMAGVVYESTVEGGLTRLMAVFEDYDNLDKIGSVRSARPYFVNFALEFEAIYCHFGQVEYAQPLLDLSITNNLSGLSSAGDIVYYRSSDRVAPHNAYASAEGIKEGMEYMGYSNDYTDSYTGHYVFNEDDENEITLTDGEAANKVVCGYAVNKPWFEYNSEDRLYYRFQYGDIQYDDMTGEQLAYKNVILQYVNYTMYDDSYLNIDVASGGYGKYITNGQAIDITWRKDQTYGPTRYYDANGNEITLNQGHTWVSIITNSSNVEIQ